MKEEIFCPNCGSSNIVGYKGSYECFDCGYKWKKSHVKKLSLRREIIPLWKVLLIISLIIAIAVAVPATWHLIAQGRITIKAAPKGAVTVEPIEPSSADLGNITLNPGETFYLPLIFKVKIEDVPFHFSKLYVGYNPCPPKLFHIKSCRWGTSLDSMSQTCFEEYSIGASLTEDNWRYYEYKPEYHATNVILDPGEYYFNITLALDTGYPEQNITFDFKVYIELERIS